MRGAGPALPPFTICRFSPSLSDETVNLHNGVSNHRDVLRSSFKDI